MSTPEKFMEFYKKLVRMDIKLMDFHEVFAPTI
jgi:hypothetical protein